MGDARLTTTTAHAAATGAGGNWCVGRVGGVDARADNRATDLQAPVQQRYGVALGLGIDRAVERVIGDVGGLIFRG